MSINITSTTSSAAIPTGIDGQFCNPNEVEGPPRMGCTIPLVAYNNHTNNTYLLQSCCSEPVDIVDSCNVSYDVMRQPFRSHLYANCGMF